ncbi:oxysterol-binding protein-related protein 5-like isoform X1 [Acipenser ruthenus]|uniref:oxysterol-binding protein-related protein 5-like isoform X1 n=2 Tax=Acipenser ruthenus TaxID=7906 RepID=UPI0027424F54|nr:oxysterol-binding protein-related protein 5-like isoform X1 [Acipenser ruthenus]
MEVVYLKSRLSSCDGIGIWKTHTAQRMKEENLFRRRFSLCPNTSTPLKIDPHTLTRNLSYGGDNDLYPLSPGTALERNGLPVLKDEISNTPMSNSKSDSKLSNGHDKEFTSPTDKMAKKESLKVQKKNYRQEKKRAAKELFSALKDPSVVIMANWLKIRGSLKSWTKLWCVLKPGVLLIFKTPKVDHWVGTTLLNACKLIERPSKKDGFCFKLYHPLDKSIWAMKGPKGENVGSFTQPLPSSHLIFRAASESDGRCWMDAIELALSCSSLYKLSSKQGKDVDLCCSSNSSHILNLLQSSTLSHQELFQMTESGNHHMENDGYSDKSDCGANESSQRVTEESDTDQSETQKDVLIELQATSYVEQGREEMAEAGVACQTETVSEENKGLMWTMLKQLRPGMDLSRVVLPTFILEPRSFLDKLSDYYYHADFLSQASVEESAYSRMKQVLRWYLSGFYKKPKGLKKPYNPILGETFRCCWLHPETDSCTFYVAEQVSHHPPVSAFYVCNKKDGFCVSGSILAKSKFYGNSLSAILDGKAMLFFLKRDEEYIITMPYAHCRGILYGTMTMELGGKVTIECEKTKYTAELEFKLKPFLCISSSVNMISGRILLGDELQATIDGHWDGEVFLCEKKSGDRNVFWSPTPEVRRQRLKRQVVHLGDQGEFESERLWLHVTNAIISKDQHKATQEKFILEEAQRQAARDQGDREWTPRLFRKDPISQDWLYKYADTNPWDSQMNLVEFEKDGVIQTLGTDGRRHNGISYSKKWATKQKTDCKRRKTSQNTESSSSTPEPSHESSDNESRNTGIAVKQWGCRSSGTKCIKEESDMPDIEATVASIQRTQLEMQRNLNALTRQVIQRRNSWDNFTLNCRYWLIICILLVFQLFINYIFK